VSDFLSNLVSRTLTRKPVIEPRRASIFEPVSGLSGQSADIDEESVESPTSFVSHPTLPRSAALPSAPVPIEKTAAAAHATAPVQQLPDATTREPFDALGALETIVAEQLRRSRQPARSANERAASPLREATPQSGLDASPAEISTHATDEDVSIDRRPMEAPRIAPMRAPVETARARHQDDVAATVQPSLTLPASTPRPRDSASTITTTKIVQRSRRDEPAAVKRARAAKPSLVQTARTASRRMPEVSATATPPAPTPVQVRIGRIEIRAAPAQPSTPTRAAPDPPKLSLDDYLRARSEGPK
jgi:hypothetical protein